MPEPFYEDFSSERLKEEIRSRTALFDESQRENRVLRQEIERLHALTVQLRQQRDRAEAERDQYEQEYQRTFALLREEWYPAKEESPPPC